MSTYQKLKLNDIIEQQLKAQPKAIVIRDDESNSTKFHYNGKLDLVPIVEALYAAQTRQLYYEDRDSVFGTLIEQLHQMKITLTDDQWDQMEKAYEDAIEPYCAGWYNHN